MNKTKEIVISGLLLAIGLLLPMVFHMFELGGQIVLPMHIPVLIGGFILSPLFALSLGIITPLMGSILTSMPILFPMGIIMAFELGTYGIVASLCSRNLKLPVIPTLIISMIAGRITAGITVAILVQFFGIKMNPIIFVKGAIITGMPGIIIQLVCVPAVVYGVRRCLEEKRV